VTVGEPVVEKNRKRMEKKRRRRERKEVMVRVKKEVWIL